MPSRPVYARLNSHMTGDVATDDHGLTIGDINGTQLRFDNQEITRWVDGVMVSELNFNEDGTVGNGDVLPNSPGNLATKRYVDNQFPVGPNDIQNDAIENRHISTNAVNGDSINPNAGVRINSLRVDGTTDFFSGVDMNENNIIALADPVGPRSATNRDYVDGKFPVQSGQIANGAVTTDKIQNGTIIDADMADTGPAVGSSGDLRFARLGGMVHVWTVSDGINLPSGTVSVAPAFTPNRVTRTNCNFLWRNHPITGNDEVGSGVINIGTDGSLFVMDYAGGSPISQPTDNVSFSACYVLQAP